MYDINRLFTVNTKAQAVANELKHFTDLAHTVTIVGGPINDPKYCGVGPLLNFEASDAELIEHGLVDAQDLPSRARGRQTRFFDGIEFRHARRMTDGRIALTISAGLVRQRDVRYTLFLVQAMGECA